MNRRSLGFAILNREGKLVGKRRHYQLYLTEAGAGRSAYSPGDSVVEVFFDSDAKPRLIRERPL